MEWDSIFWFCSLLGTGLFLIQLVWMFIGGDPSHELDPHSDVSDGKFKWGRRQITTAFIMMFGWVGLASLHQFKYTPLLSAAMALFMALFSSLLIHLIFKIAQKAHSTGSIFNLEEAIGKKATVYQRIPHSGSGKIVLPLNQMTQEIDAISLSGEEIPSFTEVEVVKKSNSTTVIVKSLNK